MTFKKIVGGMVERDAEIWVNDLLNQNDVCFHWTDAMIVEMDTSDKHSMYWTVQVSVMLQGYSKINLYVGGTADESGICHSVIWNENRDAIWFSVERTRETFHIDEFKVA